MEDLKPCPANSCPLTPLSFLERAAVVYADCPSVVHHRRIYTWSETHARCLKVASSLASLRFPAGAVVSVVAPNIPAMYELQFAVPMAGCVLNNINTRLDARTVAVILRHSDCKAVFVDSHHRRLVEKAASLLPTPSRPILIVISDGQDEPEENDDPPSRTYEGMVRTGNPEFDWVRPKSEWDPMTLNYTSGTTSSPKGVVHSHRSISIITVDSLLNWSVPKQPVYLWTLPMFHSNGWSYTWGMAAVGGTNVCLRKFTAGDLYAAIYSNNVTHMCGAPVILTMLANCAVARRLRSPVQFMTGGAPPPPSVVLRAEELGFVVSHGYGLTEVAGVVVSCAWKLSWNRFPAAERARMKARQGVRTVGLTAADVVDPVTGESVRRDGVEMGEIVLRGGSLMLGYLKNPAATAESLRGGWLYTGDVGVMHPDGYMEIKDRSKDLIISGGENVSSVEVESVLYTNPAVNEAAVVARPDDFWGETPCAFLSLKEGVRRAPPEKEVIEFCRARMPHFMVPKTVVFMAELPKTATGKVQKYALRDIANKMGALATAATATASRI
ncbi:2-methylpropanoate--CoA ligase CCL4-like [Andrographis paniculata]|uniref:2-methylpropanoate--CoA ligase CCL4-like n=1 Tax=Andrographis paniculata TaxID=175694 RepID=UPI0021E78BEC|nr:2-methylpropanoate--CoA ligase CCL4-like [Andrographis paniculata]